MQTLMTMKVMDLLIDGRITIEDFSRIEERTVLKQTINKEYLYSIFVSEFANEQIANDSVDLWILRFKRNLTKAINNYNYMLELLEKEENNLMNVGSSNSNNKNISINYDNASNVSPIDFNNTKYSTSANKSDSDNSFTSRGATIEMLLRLQNLFNEMERNFLLQLKDGLFLNLY